jgi:hypothetical protein
LGRFISEKKFFRVVFLSALGLVVLGIVFRAAGQLERGNVLIAPAGLGAVALIGYILGRFPLPEDEREIEE